MPAPVIRGRALHVRGVRGRAARVLVAAALATPSAVVLPAAGVSRSSCAHAADQHHASVVVEHGDGSTLRRCVGFDGAGINGYDLLTASGIQFSTVDYGGSLGQAVCQVDGEPSSYPPSCFSSGGSYWALFVARAGSGWQTTSHGISNTSFGEGDSEGLRYDPQGGSLPPPQTSGAGVCPAPTANPPPAATPPATSTTTTTRSASTAPSSTPASSPAAVAAPAAPASMDVSPPLANLRVESSASAAPRPVAASAPDAASTPHTAGFAFAAVVIGLLGLLGWQLSQRRSP